MKTRCSVWVFDFDRVLSHRKGGGTGRGVNNVQLLNQINVLANISKKERAQYEQVHRACYKAPNGYSDVFLSLMFDFSVRRILGLPLRDVG